MVRRNNIKHLCAEIRAHHVQGYLLADGWQLVDEQREDALIFEKEQENEENPCRIWIWASHERPKFASRIQNLLFSLSVIEGREPLEVGVAVFEAVADLGRILHAQPPSFVGSELCRARRARVSEHRTGGETARVQGCLGVPGRQDGRSFSGKGHQGMPWELQEPTILPSLRPLQRADPGRRRGAGRPRPRSGSSSRTSRPG